MKILVTGGSGTLGGYVMRELKVTWTAARSENCCKLASHSVAPNARVNPGDNPVSLANSKAGAAASIHLTQVS
jgi:nucleoside-diphosphate-sugar epimerase